MSASNGTANASLMTVQSVRAKGATTISVNTTTAAPAKFFASMGTPHTFTDPITGESITTISEATAVDFAGSIVNGNVNIDAISPGYVDNGNAVGDIVIIRPTVDWANNTANVIGADHADDGTHNPNTVNPVGAMLDFAGVVAPSGWLIASGQAVSRTTYAALFAVLNPSIGATSITIASPAVLTITAHGLNTGDPLYLTTTGTLPTGLTANTQYFSIYVDANTIRLATTYANAVAGTAIATSGTQSGVHTTRRTPYGLGDGATTFNVPDTRGRATTGFDVSQVEFNGVGRSGGAKTVDSSHTHQYYLPVGQASGNVLAIRPDSIPNSSFNSSPTDTVGTLQSPGAGAVELWKAPTLTGGNAALNNLQPYIAINKIIKT